MCRTLCGTVSKSCTDGKKLTEYGKVCFLGIERYSAPGNATYHFGVLLLEVCQAQYSAGRTCIWLLNNCKQSRVLLHSSHQPANIPLRVNIKPAVPCWSFLLNIYRVRINASADGIAENRPRVCLQNWVTSLFTYQSLSNTLAYEGSSLTDTDKLTGGWVGDSPHLHIPGGSNNQIRPVTIVSVSSNAAVVSTEVVLRS